MIKRVYIEITNICNLKCSFCLQTKRSPQMMTPSQFEALLPQIKAYTDYIYLHVQGEPLTHPSFEEILSLCDQYQMQVQLVTNGTLLERYPDLDLHESIRKVSFSLQSVEYHHNSDTDAYMQRIIAFAERCSARKRPYCEIRFWRTDQSNMPATARCMELLKQRFTFEASDRRGSSRIMDGVYVSADNMFEWPSVLTDSESDAGTCHGAVDQIAILSNGTVVPCCLDNDGTIDLGNVFETSLDSILKAERYTQLVSGFRAHRITEELCRKCTFRHRFDKKLSKR